MNDHDSELTPTAPATKPMKLKNLLWPLIIIFQSHILLSAADFSPQPVTVITQSGSFDFKPEVKIYFETREAPRLIERSLFPLADVFAGELEILTGIRPTVIEKTFDSKPGPGDISLEFADVKGTFAETEECEDQSYEVTVGNHVTITSGYFKGIAYGTATILQALKEDAGSFSISRMTVRDSPESAYRAVMIDLARQPSSIGTIREIIRLARLCKLRYVQLHFTDDQNFTFPFDPVTDHVSNNFIYNREALKQLASYADARGVTIIPELDLPGHSSKLRASGYLSPSANDADVAAPANYPRIAAIVDDMLNVFPNSPYFHIGGDESGAGRELVPFLNAMNVHLRGKPANEQKRLLVWEGFHGAPVKELPPTGPDRVVVMSWESRYNTPWNLLENGYTVINASWKPLYIVGSGAVSRQPHVTQRMWSPQILQTWDKNQFMHWQPGTPVFEDQGPSDPTKDDGTWDAAVIGRETQVIGGQMLSWEQNEKTIVRDLLPRLPVMADRLWNPLRDEDFDTFSARLAAVRERLLAIVHPVEILPLSTTPESPLSLDYRQYDGERLRITLRNRSRIDGVTRYETGDFSANRISIGFAPIPETSAASPRYVGPFELEGGFGIRAQLYRSSDGSPVDGHDWQHFANLENRVAVTEFDVPRRPLNSVPDFASYSTEKIIRNYALPILHGPYLNEKVTGQMFLSTLAVPGSGTFDLSMQTSDGRASVYIDLDHDGVWDADEKIIIDSPPNDRPVHAEVKLGEGKYRIRIDHASGAVGALLWLKLDGPGTGGNKDITEFLNLPEIIDAPPSIPLLARPLDGAISVRPNQTLGWSCEKAESYDVYFWKKGFPKPAQAIASGLRTAVFDPGPLDRETSYSWEIVAQNRLGSVKSATSVFTTTAIGPVGLSVGWNYVGVGGVGLNTVDLAGAPGFEQTGWNNHTASGQGVGTVPFDLSDNAGNPAIKVTAWTLSAENSWHHDQTASPEQILMNDFNDREPSITFSGIPFGRYSLVIYYGNNEGPSQSTLVVTGAKDDRFSKKVITGNSALSSIADAGWQEETGTATAPSNYTIFEGLDDPQVTIALKGENNNGISAIQFIDTTAK